MWSMSKYKNTPFSPAAKGGNLVLADILFFSIDYASLAS